MVADRYGTARVLAFGAIVSALGFFLRGAIVDPTVCIASGVTLAGLVFFSHQTGAFIGAWLGGRIYDSTNDYSMMWWAAIGLGLLATIIHLPIKEKAGALARTEANR